MASRIQINPLDAENKMVRPIKAVKPQVGTRRNALAEVGNKVSFQETNVVKKTNIAHQNLPVKKSPIKIKPIKPEEKQQNGLNRRVIPKLNKIGATVSLFKSQDSVIAQQTKKLQSYSSKQLDVLDVDESDKGNPFLVAEYIKDIYTYLLSLEGKMPVKKGFLLNHESTPKMRSVLVNWLVDVHLNFNFFTETLHLTVGIIDRYLQENTDVGCKTLQLVGTASLLLAAKYEEMYLPGLSDFVYICDDMFSREQILEMEKKILQGLKFNLGRPLSVHFLRRFNKILCVKSEHHNLGKYLLELALLQYDLCHIDPSIQAAAACCLSVGILNNLSNPATAWTDTIIHYTTYTYDMIRETVLKFAVTLTKTETMKYQAIRSKYAASKFSKISTHSKLKGPLIKKLTAESVFIKT